MDIVLMIIYATIVLGFLVFIHEGGHYLASRAFGVRVTEFMIGLPGPSIGFTKGGTRFGLTAVPLGGYAKVCGMEAGEMSPHLEPVLAALYRRGTANMEDIAADCGITDDEACDALDELVEWGSCSGPTKKDQYNTYRAPEVRLTKKQRAALAASAAPAEIAAEASVPAASTSISDAPASSEVASSDSVEASAPATLAVSVSAPNSVSTTPPVPMRAYELGEPREVADAHALFESEYRQQYRAQPFWKRSVILVAGVTMNLLFAILAIVFIYSVIGFDYQYTDTGEIVHVTLTPLQSIQAGVSYIGMVVQAVVGLLNPSTAAETVSNSTSIMGIAVIAKSAAEQGFISFLEFSAMISVSLGVMNLLPIPPLDGGRFVVEVFQKVSRKVVSTRAMNYLSAAGMLLFMGFFLVMMNQDIQRFVFGNWG